MVMYFWFLLFGLSGTVIAILPISNSGFNNFLTLLLSLYPSRFASSIILFGFSHIFKKFISIAKCFLHIILYIILCIQADNLYIFDFILYINWCIMGNNWGNCCRILCINFITQPIIGNRDGDAVFIERYRIPTVNTGDSILSYSMSLHYLHSIQHTFIINVGIVDAFHSRFFCYWYCQVSLCIAHIKAKDDSGRNPFSHDRTIHSTI